MFKQLLKLLSKGDLISQAFDDTQSMMNKSYKLFQESVYSLKNNKKAGFDIYELDREINSYEKKIRRKILEHLSLNPEQDLIASLVLTSIVISIERIGDYSKNIYEVVDMYKNGESVNISEKLSSTEAVITKSFCDVAEAFKNGDEQTATKIIHTLDPLRKTFDSYIYKDVLTEKDKDTRTIITNVLYSRYLKRVAAHLENIATSIVNPFDKIGFYKSGNVETEAD